VLQKVPDSLPPWGLPSLKGKGSNGGDIGAFLDPALFPEMAPVKVKMEGVVK